MGAPGVLRRRPGYKIASAKREPHVSLIYLDHNATTPVREEVLEVTTRALREAWGNPSSGHGPGRAARAAVERARAQVAALIGAAPEEILFTSGGTEANNLAIRGVAAARPRGRVLLTSVVEHPATARPAAELARQGRHVRVLGVDERGVVRISEISSAEIEGLSLASLMLANNETGALQPVAELARAAHGVGALVHTDAAQAVGKVPVDVEALGVDLLSIAGHKLYAPKGVGALYLRRGTPLAPLLLGAGHERGLRPGTENVAFIAGLGEACALAGAELEQSAARLRGLRDRLHAGLRARIPGLALNGPEEGRLPNTLNLRLPGVRGRALLAATPELAASTGSACHEGGHESPSGVLLAMGLDAEAALGALRLSLGRDTQEAEVDEAITRIAEAWARLLG
ncbi:MAG: cysteine desulfurase [Alphaproteobacteria bacterium]|nr:cysteine desulfurase [Alphaproteobacteria bacterium]